MKNISLTTFLKKRTKENGEESKKSKSKVIHTTKTGHEYYDLNIAKINGHTRYIFRVNSGQIVSCGQHPDKIDEGGWDCIFTTINDMKRLY